MFFLAFKKSIYLFIWEIELKREERWKQRWLTGSFSKWLPAARSGPGQTQGQELPLSLPQGYWDPRTWVIFCYFPRHISRELGQKWSSGDSNRLCYRMLALPAAASPATPQHWPLPCTAREDGRWRLLHTLGPMCCSCPLKFRGATRTTNVCWLSQSSWILRRLFLPLEKGRERSRQKSMFQNFKAKLSFGRLPN